MYIVDIYSVNTLRYVSNSLLAAGYTEESAVGSLVDITMWQISPVARLLRSSQDVYCRTDGQF